MKVNIQPLIELVIQALTEVVMKSGTCILMS
jgi:hypothetical protein